MIQDIFLRRVFYSLAVCGSLALIAGVFAAVVKYKPFGVPDHQMDEWNAIQTRVATLKKEAEESFKTNKFPKLYIENTEHDFGRIPPHSSISHTFIVENRGDSPLRLQAGDTSCKCTLSKVGMEWVAPGQSTEITLTFNAGKKRDLYRQYAVIYTNDLDHQKLELGVNGKIQTLYSADQQELAFADLDPSSVAKRELQVYSQVWHGFELGKIETDLEGVTWKVVPLSPEQLEVLEATCGWHIDISLASAKQTPYFAGVLRIEATEIEVPKHVADLALAAAANPEAEDVEESGQDAENALPENILEVPLRGRLLKPLSIYGPNVHAEQGIKLGSLNKGQSYEFKFLMKVRSQQLPERLEIESLKPEFIQGEIAADKRPGYYSLHLRVPDDAPIAVFDELLAGELVIASEILPAGQLKIPLRGVISEVGKK